RTCGTALTSGACSPSQTRRNSSRDSPLLRVSSDRLLIIAYSLCAGGEAGRLAFNRELSIRDARRERQRRHGRRATSWVAKRAHRPAAPVGCQRCIPFPPKDHCLAQAL